MSVCNSAGDGYTQLAAGRTAAVHNVQEPPGPTLNINTSPRLLINLATDLQAKYNQPKFVIATQLFLWNDYRDCVRYFVFLDLRTCKTSQWRREKTAKPVNPLNVTLDITLQTTFSVF